MKVLRLAIGLVAVASLIQGCAQAAKKDEKKAAGAGDEAQNADGTNTSTTIGGTAITAEDFPDGFYTGFDGASKFSLLLPGFRNYTVADETVAKIETLTVKVSEATLATLIAEAKKTKPDINEEQIKKQFSRERKVYKLTPLKAGQTKLTAAPRSGGSGGSGSGGGGSGKGGGGSGDSWKKPSTTVLIIENYAADAVAKGKDRYTRDGDDNKRPCASCHESGEAGAPPHELGDVMSIPDVAAMQWIKTGKLNGRTAKVKHTWEFESDAEAKDVVAYLRTKQTVDVEQLIKLEFEDALASGFVPGGRPGGGGGGSGGAATTTGGAAATTTGTGQ